MTLSTIQVLERAADLGLKLAIAAPDRLTYQPIEKCPLDFVETLKTYKGRLLNLLRLPFVMVFSETLGETIFFCADDDTRTALIEAGARVAHLHSRRTARSFANRTALRRSLPLNCGKSMRSNATFNAKHANRVRDPKNQMPHMARTASPSPESEFMKDKNDDITKTPSDSAEEIAQTEMPRATAEEIAQKVIIKVLADEFNRLMGQDVRILALRKEFEERGIPDADDYSGADAGERGRCPVCYKTGERILDSAVCREHSVRWTWRGKHYHSADDPADPDYKPEVEKLESFREVEPFYEPLPIRNALDSASSNAHTDGLARRIEEELVEVVMENLPSNGMVIAEQEKRKMARDPQRGST